jgi:hypothetical protein
MATSADILAWINAHPGATDAQIYSAMQTNGVTPQDFATATGGNLADITSRYNTQAGTPAPAGTPAYQPLPMTPPQLSAPGGGSMATPAFHAPTWNAPTPLSTTYTENPYLQAQADAIGRRTQDLLGTTMLGIQGHSVDIGGLGGSRQGVAQGIATGAAADSLQGQLASLYGTDYTNAMNRNLQQYGIDTGVSTARYGADSGLAGARYGADSSRAAAKYAADASSAASANATQASMYGTNANYNIGLGNLANTYQDNQNDFYTAQRGQDLSSIGLAANLYNTGTNGQWAPINNANGVYSPYTGYGTSTTSGNQGGGAGGLFGGALLGSSIYNYLR